MNEASRRPEVVLGFDAREQFLSPDESWSNDRRNQFLLRPEVVKPLSVDAWVWPSIFGKGLPLAARRPDQVRPPWTGSVAELWDDLAGMDSYIEPYRHLNHWRVAIGMVSDANAATRTLAPNAMMDGLNRQCLGYDVADEYLLSGLSNCGYTPEEREALAATWAPRLNEHHLFDDVDHAFEFSRMTSARVVEHAPFFVYALYLLGSQC
ncbi:MAG TPA: hypothetical protein VGH20_11435 [Myxococcales bacterium]|jgi:hypothetical protein